VPWQCSAICLQVDDILAKQAVQANKSIAEAIEMLLGYHNTFNKRYLQTRNAFLNDAKVFNAKPDRSVEELKDMIFQSLPFMQTLFPGLLELGGIAVRNPDSDRCLPTFATAWRAAKNNN